MAKLTLNQNERKELIAALVTNCAGWDEEDIELLVNMRDDKLYAHASNCAQMVANAAGEEIESTGELPDTLEPSSAEEINSAAEDEGWDEETVAEGEDQGDNVAKTEEDTEGVKDQPKKCHDDSGNEIDCPDQSGEAKAEGENVTENQYLRRLPPRIRSVVVNALRFEQAQKQQLVANITSNPRNRFHESYLMNMGIDELQALSEIASPRKAQQMVFAGAAGGPTLNESVDREDLLIPPTLEFSMAKK